jgi:8-oxo-dGTP diphosphatase
LVILRGEGPGAEVLLCHHQRADGGFWCFPGGGVEPGESFAAAARREAREETGLEVSLRGVCFLQDRPAADALEWFFAAEPAPGQRAILGADPERSPTDTPVLDRLRWVPLRELPRWQVLPAGLAAALADGAMARWGLLPVPEPDA